MPSKQLVDRYDAFGNIASVMPVQPLYILSQQCSAISEDSTHAYLRLSHPWNMYEKQYGFRFEVEILSGVTLSDMHPENMNAQHLELSTAFTLEIADTARISESPIHPENIFS